MADVRRNYKIVLGVDDQTAGALAKIEGRFRNLDSKIFNMLKVGALAAGGAIAYAVKQASDEEAIMKRLSFAVERTGKSYESVKGELRSFFDTQMAFTRYSDDETAEALQTIMALSGNYEQSLRAVKIAQDFASTGIVDLGTASLLMGKALVGATETLGRYGITMEAVEREFGKFTSDADKAEKVMRYLENRFSGQAQNDLKTFAGAFKQLRTYIGEAAQTIGDALLPQLTEWAKQLTAYLKTDEAQRRIKQLSQDIAEGMKKVYGAIRDVVDFVRDNGQIIIGFFVALTAARIISGIASLAANMGALVTTLSAVGRAINPLVLLAAGFVALYNVLKKLQDMAGISTLLDKLWGGGKALVTGRRGVSIEEIEAQARAFQKLQVAESAAIPKPGDWDFIGPMMKDAASATNVAAKSFFDLNALIKELGLTTSQELLDRQKQLETILSSTKDPLLLMAARGELQKIHDALLESEIAFARLQRAGLFGIRTPEMRGREGFEGAQRPGQFEAPVSVEADPEVQRFRQQMIAQAAAQAAAERYRRTVVGIGQFLSSSISSVFMRINTLADLARIRIKDVFDQLFMDIFRLIARIATEMAVLGLLSLFTGLKFSALAGGSGGIIGALFGGGGGGGGGAVGAGGPTPFIPPAGGNGGGGKTEVHLHVHGDFIGTREYSDKLMKHISDRMKYGQAGLAYS